MNSSRKNVVLQVYDKVLSKNEKELNKLTFHKY